MARVKNRSIPRKNSSKHIREPILTFYTSLLYRDLRSVLILITESSSDLKKYFHIFILILILQRQRKTRFERDSNSYLTALPINAIITIKSTWKRSYPILISIILLSLLATTSADQSIKIWQTSDFTLKSTLKEEPQQRWVWDCAFSEDSQYLVAGKE